MNVNIEVAPESIAYVFGNAFTYPWFKSAMPLGPLLGKKGSISDGIFLYEHHGAARHVAMGGTVTIRADDPETGTVKSYTVRASDFQRAFVHFLFQGKGKGLLDGGADADLCDEWLQVAVFGKVVYG